jgi:hypothetical protein
LNQLHYIRCDPAELSCLPNQYTEKLLLTIADPVDDYQQHSLPDMPAVNSAADLAALPPDVVESWARDVVSRTGLVPFLDKENQHKLKKYQVGYEKAQATIDQMVQLGIMYSGPPIKKQTLGDKHRIIKNFDELIQVYNRWQERNPEFGQAMSSETIHNQISQESNFWYSIMNSKDSAPALPPI